MKRICFAILLGVALLSWMLAIAEPSDDHCCYKLFQRNDGCYIALCAEHSDCADSTFVVYPMGYCVNAAADSAPCNHLFRMAEQPHRVSIESASEWSHEAATWYFCTCESCGKTIEAYMTDGRYYEHEYSLWEGVHVDGTLKHLYISHCDICGELFHEFVNCLQLEDGTCAETYSVQRNQ